MSRHRHTVVEVEGPLSFGGAVGDPQDPVRAAHGGYSERQTCSCGAARIVNRNGGHEERGYWDMTVLVERLAEAAVALQGSGLRTRVSDRPPSSWSEDEHAIARLIIRQGEQRRARAEEEARAKGQRWAHEVLADERGSHGR